MFIKIYSCFVENLWWFIWIWFNFVFLVKMVLVIFNIVVREISFLVKEIENCLMDSVYSVFVDIIGC